MERLVNKFGDELDTTSVLFNEMSLDVISVAGLDEITQLRLSLAKADHILDDITKITTGYIQMKTQTQSEHADSEQHKINPFVPSADTMDGLEEKLKAFSSRMANAEPSDIANNE